MKQEASNKVVAFSDRRMVIMANKIETEVYTSYIPGEDKTIVWQSMYVNGEHVQQALIGWYCGEPEDEVTKQYANMPLIGQYID